MNACSHTPRHVLTGGDVRCFNCRHPLTVYNFDSKKRSKNYENFLEPVKEVEAVAVPVDDGEEVLVKADEIFNLAVALGNYNGVLAKATRRPAVRGA